MNWFCKKIKSSSKYENFCSIKIGVSVFLKCHYKLDSKFYLLNDSFNFRTGLTFNKVAQINNI